MIAVLLAILLLFGSFLLMTAALLHNQMAPSLATAMTVPLVTAASLVAALLALGLSWIVWRMHRNRRIAKATMLAALAFSVVLALMFPLADLGFLSRVR